MLGLDVVSDHRGAVIKDRHPKNKLSDNLILVFCVISDLTSVIGSRASLKETKLLLFSSASG